MTRGLLSIACALLAIGGLAGCGASGGNQVDVKEQVRLREVLNRDPRLPDGFSARAQEAWRVPFKAGDRNCRAVLNPAGGDAPQRALTAQAAASYPGRGLSEVAGVGLAHYEGAEAEWHIGDLEKAADACQLVDVGGGTELAFHQVPVHDLGDEAVAGQLLGRLNGYPYTLNVFVVREGDMLVSLVHSGMSRIDPKRTEQLARSVVAMTRA
ncbi:hypothetical protein OIE66_29270 [Nonomuraea sp. NBC_01738]|uniref:hypothetical protein n=1 Tax=Nonomuraea sp. NBC_01738 TaxID=2976003 RepID=UPI002E0D2F38|nr:hypothetical protein OIE66_29270 [Nonomuraea sp. NBC_01738]